MGRTKARSSTAPSKEGYHHGDLRRALLDATLRLVEEHGPQGFTLRAAARAAGVSPGAPYHHFEDKDDLLAAVAEEGFELFGAALREAAERPGRSPRQRAQDVGVAYVLFAMANPTRFRVMVGYGEQTRKTDARLAGAGLRAYEFVRDVLVEGLKSASSEAVIHAEVLGWWSVVHGLAFLGIDGYLGKAGASAGRTEMVVRQVIEALDRRPRKPG